MTSEMKSDAQRRRIDSAMLDSLSTWFAMRATGYQGPHSFNDQDVAEMLARASEIMTPKPAIAARAPGGTP